MKYYRYYVKSNKEFFRTTLIICLVIDVLVFAAALPSIEVKGSWVPLTISLGITVFIMGLLFLLVFLACRKDRRVLEIMDKQGPCDELIMEYKKAHPRPSVNNHLVLAAYLKAYDKFDEAEHELTVAGNCVMADVRAKAYYSVLFVDLRIAQGRFDEAIMMYSNYESIVQPYCRNHKDAIAIAHYSGGAVLYAYKGNFSAAMSCINAMDKAVDKNRELAFTRNTALMAVYLIAGDYANADKLKSMMLKDLKTFSEFDFEAYRALVYKDIMLMESLFDPREQGRS